VTCKLFLIFAGENMTFSKLLLSSAIALLPMHNIAHAQGDPKRGEKLFEDCRACHSVERGVNGVGPTLHGVFGRRAAGRDDFRYSPALKRSGITWTPQTMDAFAADPQKTVPANRMPYAGMPDARDRADLIIYMQQVFK
jgi:cytochrome c